jgi:hypothetical protein
LDLQSPNPTTGTGYYEFVQDCLNGGLNCVGTTGCRLCFNPVVGGLNLGDRPICARFNLLNNVCNDLACCLDKQNPNPTTGTGYYEFAQDCLNGGLHCLENTGCRLCYNPVQNGSNDGNRPICDRFKSNNNGEESNDTCADESCCLDKQNPNPNTGTGYYEFVQDCLNGGLHCIGNTGCRLCFNPIEGGSNLGDRPICARFIQQVSACNDEACCLDRQNPNPNTGTGYYEFAQDCLNGGVNCIGNTGCRLCFNPVEGGSNLGNRPICLRFNIGVN